jgi:oligopeptide transport system substrate-binding protein
MRKLTGLVLALAASATMFAQDFYFNNGAEPQSLDPAKITGVPEHHIYQALFEGLMVNNAKTAKGEAGLAESWKVSNEGKTYTFKLRKATWSDGTPITAQTVVDSWYRTLDPKTGSEYAQMVYDSLEGAKAYYEGKGPKEGVKVKAIDAQTFEATFVGPMPYIIDMLAHYAWAVMPMHAIQKFGADWTKPANFVGNGPFTLKEWKPQDRLVVVKNEKYWDAKNVKLKSVTFLPIEDQATGYDKFKAGEVDWMDSVDMNRIEEIKLRKDYQKGPGSTVYYYIFNVTRKPFNDVRVRKAFSMATDRETLVKQVLKGGQIPTGGLVPKFGTFETAKGNTFNPEQAKKLLAEAGFPGGKGFPKFEVIYNTNANHKKIAEWVQQQWKTVLGVDIELKNLEWATFLDTRQKAHDFFVSRAGWAADFPDPTNYLGELLKTGSGNNDGLYSNKKADALIEKANKMAGGPARDKVLMEAENIMITQDQAFIPFYFYVNQNLIDTTKWGGWYENSMNIHPWKAIYKK